MKKIVALFMGVMLMFGLAACGNAQAGSPEQEKRSSEAASMEEENMSTAADTSASAESDIPADGKTLVVYFSVPETDSPDNMNAEEENSTIVVNGEVLGNTQYVAYLIQEKLSTDIFRIEPVTPYPMDHAELEAVATKESRDNALPEIFADIENFDQYETIFVGYPNWYGDLPRILYSLFDTYDFTGKTIVPFVTSGASGFSGTVSTIQELEPSAKVITDGYSITRNSMENAESGVTEWLSGLGC